MHDMSTPPLSPSLPTLFARTLLLGLARSIVPCLASLQIRNEYIHVPAETYCRKRAEILRDFLKTDFIFATDQYRRDLESAARANVNAEVALLSAGSIPGDT